MDKLFGMWIQLAGTLMINLIASATFSQTPSQSLVKFNVYSGNIERLNTPVSASLAGVPLHLETSGLQLFEITDDKTVPVDFQLEPGFSPVLWWILEGETPAGTVRTFELKRVAKKESESKRSAVTLKDNGKSIQAKINGESIIQYNYGVTPAPQGASELYARGGYIHPLWSPKGEVLTRIQPSDHYHHYGIWNPWTHVEYKGEEIDFWNLNKGQGTVRVKSVPVVVEGDIFGQIEAIHDHVVFNESNRKSSVALHESRDLRIWNVSPDQKVWLIDFTSTLNPATEHPFTIKKYRYQGFGFRATEKWNDETATLLTPKGKDKTNANATRARWCDVNGLSRAGHSGILFMSNPANYNFPEQLRIWPTGANGGKANVFFNFNPAQDRDWKLEPGKAYTLKYRMLVYNGKIDSVTAERYWQDFAHPPKVEIKLHSGSGLRGKKVLVYTKNGEGYVHKNIASSISAIKNMGEKHGFAVDVSDDPGIFADKKIMDYDALIFSNTNNEIFNTQAQKQGFQNYIRSGGGFVGIHSACGSQREWPWFWKVIGGKFHRHAPLQDFDVKVLDRNHPSTSFLPDVWKIKDDECYYLKHLNPGIHVLLTADLNTVEDKKKGEYPGDIFGDTFPVAWFHEFDGGRQWYTSLGHRPEHYSDPMFLKHILGGIQWAVKRP